jgi:hypothetical protein
VGILFGYIANCALLGARNDWRWVLAVGLFIGLLLLAMVAVMPESPQVAAAAAAAAEVLVLISRFYTLTYTLHTTISTVALHTHTHYILQSPQWLALKGR